MHYSNWKSVPIPKKMNAMRRDKRGYPIPFIVVTGEDGTPYFTANHEPRRLRCILENRCSICGTRLDSSVWLVGGPVSAFHEFGAYRDPGLHHECMEYALRVCPYLAAPRYMGRIDDANIAYDNLPAGVIGFLDPTMIAVRPDVFVAVGARRQIVTPGGENVRPSKPYVAVEFWREGERISAEAAEPMLAEYARKVASL